MSAWMVSDAHIDAMLTGGLSVTEHDRPRWAEDPEGDHYRRLDYLNADQVGALLVAENRRSVNYRYDEDEIEVLYTFRTLRGIVDPVVVLKAVSCYEYQSCEHPEWQASEAKRFCEALRMSMICQLPGWEDAPWGVDGRDVFLVVAHDRRMS